MKLLRGVDRSSRFDNVPDYNSYFGFRKTPFGVTPDAGFFYTNSLYKESFAALRYGIEAKRGFIVITGEAGTGKTTLLRKLMRGLEVTTHSVFVFNTPLSFTELLRLILRDLGLARRGEDRVTMLEELNDYLIEQLKKGHIVSLLIDEAQNLSDETLEGLRLLSNLETEDEKLLQIVLMAQPELERKLDQPSLRQLKQRVAVRHRLVPLKHKEVGPYIDFRLQAVGYEREDLFHPDAVERIASYSRGIPRLINMICDNALFVAYVSSKKEVAAEMIHDAARELGLNAQTQAKMESQATEFAVKEGKEQVLQAPKDEVVDELWQVPSKELEMEMARQPMRRRQGRLASSGIRILLGLVILGGAGATLYPQQTRNYLSNLAVDIEDLIGMRGENLGQAKDSGETLKEEPRGEASPIQEPAPQERPFLTKGENRDVSSPPETEKPSEFQASVPKVESLAPRRPSKPPDEIRTVRKNQARVQASNDPESERERMEFQIYKAIYNRAINGVEVSLIDSTAYLDGQVATERQKSAAERAARSVPGVKYVRNRIVVNSVPVPGRK